MTTVRLSITRVNLDALTQPGMLLLDVDEEDETVADRAIAWAQVRGYDRLVPTLAAVLDKPPESGFVAVLNKPHALLVFATWPWSSQAHPVIGQPTDGGA